jgi:1,4-dihydroxy-2-naphthoate octaprenyltransferase
MACALLEANNLRDVDGDRLSGKRTLAARLGRSRGSWLYAICVAGVVLGIVIGGEGLIGTVALALYVAPVRMAFSSRSGRELLALLQASAKVQLVLGAVLVVTFFVTR